MSFPLHPSRFCNLDKIQMQYMNTISFIVADMSHLPKQMTKITDYLYLGNFEDAINIPKLKEEGITHVLNTVHDVYVNAKTGQYFYGSEFQYFGFASEDHESYPIMNHFEDVYRFIETAREENGKCLIHCMAGINRSASLTVAYLMVTQNMGPISAVKFVFNRRGMILSNLGFIERLIKFAIDRDLLLLDKEQLLNRFMVST